MLPLCCIWKAAKAASC